MSVVAFRYKNFMAFRDTGWIELRPIGLLFGRNSSGKSAIIRGLRLLKQSLRTDDGSNSGDPNALRFAVEGQLDLGDFRSTLHQHSESAYDEEELEANKITFAFRIETPDLAEKLWQRIQQAGMMQDTNVSQLPSVVELNLEFGYGSSMNAVRLVGVHLDCPSGLEIDSQRVVFISSVRPGELIELSHPDGAGRYTTMWGNRWYWASDCYIGEQPDSDSVDPDVDWAEVEIVRRFGFLPHLHYKKILKVAEDLAEATTDYALTELAFRFLSEEIRSFLQNIEYLGPIRPQPERVYMLDRFEMDHWRAQGLGAWLEFITTTSDSVGKSDEQIVSSRGRSNQSVESSEKYELLASTIQKDPDETEETPLKSFQGRVDEWIKILELGYEVQVESNPMKNNLGYTPQVYIVKANGKRDNLADVGYGASQVLPIIATCLRPELETLRSEMQRLIIVEQPELHLHPKAQAELGDLLIQTVSKIILEKRNDGSIVPRRVMSGTNILIETHSEHLLLRLQRRIAETTAKKISIEKEVYPKELVFYFVTWQDKNSEIVEITFNISGDILDPSAGFVSFFADDLREIAELTRARISMNSKQKGEGHYG